MFEDGCISRGHFCLRKHYGYNGIMNSEERAAAAAPYSQADAPKTVKELQLRADPMNPRDISKHDFEALQTSMKKFGDLSCIVYNQRTRQMVGGHQRMQSILRAAPNAAPVITEEMFPTAEGTVAVGYIEVNNERYKYRVVDWPLEIQRAANVAANRIQGEFNDGLAEYIYSIDEDLRKLTGHTEDEINKLLESAGIIEGDEPPADDSADTFTVVIELDSEAAQKDIYDQLTAQGLKCRIK